MNHPMTLPLVTLLAFTLLIDACVPVQTQTGVDFSLRPDTTTEPESRTRVVLLEPSIDYTLRSFSDDPMVLPEEKSRIRDAVLESLSARMANLGFDVVAQPAITLSPRKKFLSRRVVANYVQLMGQRNFADDPMPTLGPMVNRVSAPAQGELLVISRYTGARKSAGQHRKERFTASMRALVSLGFLQQALLPAQYGDLEIALLDGVTGQVLWSAFTAGQPAQLDTLIERALETLPR